MTSDGADNTEKISDPISGPLKTSKWTLFTIAEFKQILWRAFIRALYKVEF